LQKSSKVFGDEGFAGEEPEKGKSKSGRLGTSVKGKVCDREMGGVKETDGKKRKYFKIGTKTKFFPGKKNQATTPGGERGKVDGKHRILTMGGGVGGGKKGGELFD